MIRFAIWLLLITTSLLFIVAVDQDATNYMYIVDELDKAASLFTGDIEVVANSPEMVWPEGPLYSESGNYILFSDNQYIDPTTNFKCGMIWKYDIQEDKLSKLLNCSGIVGPPSLNANDDGLPHDIHKVKEPGSNGLLLLDDDDDGTVLMCQHAWGRIVQFNIDDIDETTMSIDEDLVTVIVDSYNGRPLNSPNDLYLDEDEGILYFTDPPFGKQYNEDEEPFITMLDRMSQDVPAVYSINIGEDDEDEEDIEERREPIRILEYPVSKDAPKPQVPNGIGVNTENGDLAVDITDFSNPRVNIYKRNDDGTIDTTPKKVLEMKKKYEDMPFALSDGLSFNSEHNKLFVNGPGGIYIYEASEYDDNDGLDEYEMLGFLRLDDLCSNNISGGGYLWITCAKGLLRIALADTTTERELTSDERHELRRNAMYETINEVASNSGDKIIFSSEQEQRAYYYLHSGITTVAINNMKMSTKMSDYDIDEMLDNDDQFLQYIESLLESELKRVSSQLLKEKDKHAKDDPPEESESKHKHREKGDLKDYYSQIYAQEHKHFKCKNHSNISTIAEAEQKWAELHNAFIKFTVGAAEHAVEPLIPDSDLYIKFTTNDGTDTNKTSATVPRLYAAKNFSRDDVVYTSKKASFYFASASQWVGFLHSLPTNQVCSAIEFSLMKQISRPGRYLFGLVLDEGVFMRQKKGKGNVALEDDRNFAYLATKSIKEGEEIIDDGPADEET